MPHYVATAAQSTEKAASRIVCITELEKYVEECRYHHANVIHGDPVFSNILLTETPSIALLDMRGEVGSQLTMQGDMLYDLSKVYQSLLG
eukprot:scaffold150620_cov35-Tisochrysis_lutea.AAC.2